MYFTENDGPEWADWEEIFRITDADLIQIRYVYGGQTHPFLDCSNFITWLYRHKRGMPGFNHLATSQWATGYASNGFSKVTDGTLLKGDVLVWYNPDMINPHTGAKGAGHIAIFVESFWVFHCGSIGNCCKDDILYILNDMYGIENRSTYRKGGGGDGNDGEGDY